MLNSVFVIFKYLSGCCRVEICSQTEINMMIKFCEHIFALEVLSINYCLQIQRSLYGKIEVNFLIFSQTRN